MTCYNEIKNMKNMKNIGKILDSSDGRPLELPPDFQGLEHFCPFEVAHGETARAWEETTRFCREIVCRKRPRRWLTLLGLSGVGKTMLAQGVRSCIRANRPNLIVRLFRWSDVVNDHLRKGDYDIIPYLIGEVDVLVLDDIGLESGSAFSNAKLGEILDARLNKWTMMTSNFSLNQVGGCIDVRIASRMVRGDSMVVEMLNAPDWSLERFKRRGA